MPISTNIKENEASLFIFNLGYLPNSEETITTKAEETLLAFQKAYGLLREKGYIAITFYFGQEGGYDEYYKVMDYIKEKRLPIMETYRQDKRNSPLALFVYKP